MMQEIMVEAIKKYLPHRYPFLLVDRVVDYQDETYLVGLKNVTINESFFQGHFPSRSVMPGVLIVESLAQCGAILAYMSKHQKGTNDGSLFYIGSIDSARFRRVVVPGDQLSLRVDIKRRKANIWKFVGEARVAGELACSIEITSAEGKEK